MSISSKVDVTENAKLLGQEIRQLRESRDLTQAELGRRVGKSAATLSKIEAGSQFLDVSLLVKIAEALGTSPYILLLNVQLAQPQKTPPQQEVLEVFQKLVTRLGQ